MKKETKKIIKQEEIKFIDFGNGGGIGIQSHMIIDARASNICENTKIIGTGKG